MQLPSDSLPDELTRSWLNIYPTDYCNRRCSFCKLLGVLTEQRDRRDMTPADIDKIIDFCRRSGISDIRILGGEPSCHPGIVELMARVFERGLAVSIFFTNATFENDRLIDCLLRHDITVNVNYFPADQYEEGQRDLVHANMSRLFVPGAYDGMVGRELTLNKGALSITFYRPDQEYQYIIEAAVKYGVGAIRWAVSECSTTMENEHVRFAMLKEMVPVIVDFDRDATLAGVSTAIECSLVPCVFTRKQLHFLTKFTHNFFPFTCAPVLDVFPDLSVHYCMGMPIVSWITDTNTVQDILVEQMQKSECFRMRPRSEACAECEWWRNRLCQGYCLQYKYDMDNPADRELLNGFDWMRDRAKQAL